MARTNDTDTTGKVDLLNTDSSSITDIQRELNAIARYTGKTTNTAVTTAPAWVDNTIGASSDSLFDRIENIQANIGLGISSITDTNSIDLTVTSHALSADLKLSASGASASYIKATNVIKSDGLLSQVPVLVGDSGSGGTAGVVPAPAAGDAAALKFLKANGTWDVPTSSPTSPTVQRFTSGSGTYTTPANVKYIKVTLVGGGAGGGGAAGSGGSPTSGTAGSNSTFGSSLLTANGGALGPTGGTSAGGSGGSVTINSPAVAVISAIGGAGAAANIGLANGFAPGGNGGASMLGGEGKGGAIASAGGAGAANTGGGGAGGGAGAGSSSGVGSAAGGGAGGGIVALIYTPSSTYSYAVGGGGSGGNAGTGGGAGGAGGAGVLVVEEFY